MLKSLRFWRLISHKGVKVGHMLLLNTSRKSYLRSPLPPSHLTLSDIKSSKLRSWKWSKIDTWMMRYCVRVNPRYQFLISIDFWCKSPFVIPTPVVKQSAKVIGPLVTVHVQPEKCGLKLKVVLKLRDIYMEKCKTGVPDARTFGYS